MTAPLLPGPSTQLTAKARMSQSRRMSLVESISNVVIGYVLAIATQLVVFPWFGLNPSLGENLSLGGIFVGISLLRSYTLRRIFERWRRE